MKKIAALLILVLFSASVSNAQFRSGDDLTPVNKTTNNLILGIFNPKNFSMKHSFQVSMLSSSYGNVSLTSYVNSMQYRISDKMKISADVKLQYSPYANSSLGKDFSSQLQNDLTGLTLSRVAFDYKISDNAYLKFEYRNMNNEYYSDRYSDPFNSYEDNWISGR